MFVLFATSLGFVLLLIFFESGSESFKRVVEYHVHVILYFVIRSQVVMRVHVLISFYNRFLIAFKEVLFLKG